MSQTPGKFEMTPELLEKFRKSVEESKENNTPAPGNVCKKDGCGGKVVRKVSSLFRGRYDYHLPACGKCGRVYLLAVSAPTVGEREFEQMLHKRMDF